MAETDSMTRILVVDDHPIAMRGICMVIDGEADMTVCAAAGTSAEALRLLQETEPDMAIVDLRLGEQSGLDLVRDLLTHRRELPILVYSMYDDELYAERAIRAGARGYLMKHEPPADVVAAIRTVRNGSICLRKGLALRILGRILQNPEQAGTPSLATLTDRELQVFQAVAAGKSREEIAQGIHLSAKTIDGYRRSITRKLNLRDVTELSQFATRFMESGRI